MFHWCDLNVPLQGKPGFPGILGQKGNEGPVGRDGQPGLDGFPGPQVKEGFSLLIWHSDRYRIIPCTSWVGQRSHSNLCDVTEHLVYHVTLQTVQAVKLWIVDFKG